MGCPQDTSRTPSGQSQITFCRCIDFDNALFDVGTIDVAAEGDAVTLTLRSADGGRPVALLLSADSALSLSRALSMASLTGGRDHG